MRCIDYYYNTIVRMIKFLVSLGHWTGFPNTALAFVISAFIAQKPLHNLYFSY